MSVKKSARKRESVFKAHVLERLYPSETAARIETTPPNVSPTNTWTPECPQTTHSREAGVKLYTVQLPPDGLPAAPTPSCRASHKSPEITLRSASSEEESTDVLEDEEQPPRRRKRKHKHRKETQGSPAETTSQATGDGNAQSPTSQTVSSSASAQPTDTSSLTKNQRRKLRKRRAKLGRLQNRSPVPATEFTCRLDAREPGGAHGGDDGGSGDEATRELIDFTEAVWRVYSCDVSKATSVNSQAQEFHTIIDNLSSGELSREVVSRLTGVKRLLVLQDFPRARVKLGECEDTKRNSPESETISIFSTLAGYWMTDIAASAHSLPGNNC